MTNAGIRGCNTTISLAALGDVMHVTISDQTPTNRYTNTFTLTRDSSGAWTVPPDLSDPTTKLLADLAARVDTMTS